MKWTRRDFLGTAGAGVVAAAAFPGSVLARIARTGDLVEIRRDVGFFTLRGGTIGWLANRDGTLVVDSQYADTARVFLDALADRGALPPEVLINTHHHGDHTSGNGEFQPSLRHLVAHCRVPDLQRRAAEASGSGSVQTYADTTFQEEWGVDVGEETVRAKHYGSAHTSGDSVVFFERAGIVHTGDLVFNRVFPFIDRAAGATVRGWIDVLERIAADHAPDTVYVFGHGKPGLGMTGTRADILHQRDFLSAALDAAASAIARGQSRDEAATRDRLPGFEDYEQLVDWLDLPLVLGTAYQELTEDPSA
jgi:cyclase